MGKIFQCLQKKAATHLGPDFPVNSEIYKNTRFEIVENVFNITQNLIKDHSEETLIVRGLFITIMDEIDTGQRSSDQMGEGKSLRLR